MPTPAHKTFFDAVAHGIGFHPIEQSNRWYDLTRSEIASYKVLLYQMHFANTFRGGSEYAINTKGTRMRSLLHIQIQS